MTLGYSILLSSSPHSIALYLAKQISWNRNKAQQTFSSAILDCDTIRVIEKFQIVNTCFSYSAVVNCFVLQSKHKIFQKANDIGLAMANIKRYYARNQTITNFFRLSIFFKPVTRSIVSQNLKCINSHAESYFAGIFERNALFLISVYMAHGGTYQFVLTGSKHQL